MLSRKQVGVIYRNWKMGTIEAKPETIKFMYELVDTFNAGSQYHQEWASIIRSIVDSIFEGDFELAQSGIRDLEIA